MARLHTSLALLCLLAAARAAEPPAPPPKPPTEAPKTKAALADRIKVLEAAKDMAAEVRDPALKLYRDALALHEAAEQHAAKAQEFETLQNGAPDALKKYEAQLKALSAAPPFEPPTGLAAEAAQTRLDSATADLAAATRQLTDLKAEAAQRQDRRRALGDLIRAAKDHLAQLLQPKPPPPEAKDPPEILMARAALAHAQLVAAQAEAPRLEKELASYDARDKLLQLRLEVYGVQERQAKDRADKLQALVDRLRRDEADAARRKAERDLQKLREVKALQEATSKLRALEALAADNVRLTNLRTGPQSFLKRKQTAIKELGRAEEQIRRIKTNHDDVVARMKVTGLTNAIGLLLRKFRAELPSVRVLRGRIHDRQAAIADVQLQSIDFREQSGAMLSVDEKHRALAARLEAALGQMPSAYVGDYIRSLLVQERENVRALADDSSNCFSALVDLDSAERKLIAETESFAAFIDENVLWIRSADPLTLGDAARTPAAVRWLLSGSEWRAVAAGMVRDLRSEPVLYAVALVLLGLAVAGGRVAARRVDALADLVADFRNDRFAYTLRGLACTAAIALPVPLVLLFAGWRLGLVDAGACLPRALGVACRQAAWVVLPVGLFHQVCRPRGLGEVHFRWKHAAAEAVRRVIFGWLVLVLPLLFVVGVLEHQPSEEFKSGLGRLAFLAAMAVTAILTYRLLRAKGPVFAAAADASGALERTRKLWFPLLVAAPLALAVIAALGYGFTAIQLFWRLLATFLLVLGLVTVQAIVLRWLFVVRRRVALEQARRRREEAQERRRAEQAADDDNPGGPADSVVLPTPPEPIISIAELRQQTSTLVRWLIAIAGFLGLYLIWVDVLPALGILNRVRFWGDPATAGAAGTLGGLLLAIVVVVLTVVAAGSLPSLLGVTVLQRLPLDAGARYAVSQVSRYVITGVGVVVACALVGISWSSVQWLLAALTVGLGFGLQEIFANFISGLILLFERPIRVGDTVTIGDVSGTVTRIRIRATTITDWDRKELIVPNKEFITGRLVNWSLSDEILRIRIPVGIAYGSNTRLAHDVLLRVAGEAPDVLDEPAPQAIFLKFGDSSLDFELRVHVRSILSYIRAIDDLHTRIDQAFRQSDIEIAFPQHDLHIRSSDHALPIAVEQARAADRSSGGPAGPDA